MKQLADNYILSSGHDGHDRLRLLCEIHDPSTRRLLLHAGLGPSTSFVEFGCGLGSVCRWAASQGARAVGFDLSEAHLGEAARMAREAAIPQIEFRIGNVYDIEAQIRDFDVAYCRFLLSHLSEPVEAMRAMARCLKPGGLLVCEEPDVLTIAAEPRSENYAAVVDAIIRVADSRGLDYRLGRRLALHAQRLGLEVLHADAYQRHFFKGREKGYWTWSFIEAKEALLSTGVRPADFDDWISGMTAVDLDERVLVAHASVHQLLARKRL